MKDGPLRILHLTAGSDAGGLSRYILDLCLAMHDRGHKVAVAGERGAWHEMFESAPWPWIDAPLKGGFFDLRRAIVILQDHLGWQPVDVLHVHYRRPAIVARRLQVARRPPILYTLHLSHLSLRWPIRWVTDFGDHLHVPSTQARDWAIESAGVPADLISTIFHGIDPARFPLADPAAKLAARVHLGLGTEDLVGAYVGRLDNPKNEDWLVDLWLAARDRLPHLRLLIAGNGPHEYRLWRRIQSVGAEKHILLLGHRDPLPIYQASNLLLLPSAREGFSLVSAEAMSAGTPVLRTRTSGTTDLVIEEVTGRSTPIDRDAFIGQAIEMLLQPAALSEMGRAAANHIRANFTFERQVEQTIALYRKLAQGVQA